MDYQTLRKKHKKLTYQSFSYYINENELYAEFTYTLDNEYTFRPTLRIPLNNNLIDSFELKNMIFNFGIMEGMNYWKSAVPHEYAINAGKISEPQIRWWHDLFLSSLGEFYFVNNINFCEDDFLKITSDAPDIFPLSTREVPEGNLILSSGGKDSAITLELLKDEPQRQATFTQVLNNPIRAASESARVAGIAQNYYAYKTVDPQLQALTKQGYLSGHMPFSAMVSFLSIIIASIYNLRNVIASNESGANEGNLEYLGKIINHQYAKSFEYETKFRTYVSTYISTSLNYYSILRSINELQIAYLFSTIPQYHTIFRSCNRNIKTDSWCGECAKCAFIFLVLSAFMNPQNVEKIFGAQLLERELIRSSIKELVGLSTHKPLECVGTQEESINAVRLICHQYVNSNSECPQFLKELLEGLQSEVPKDTQELLQTISVHWNYENNIPAEYSEKLKRWIRQTYENTRN